MEKEILSKKDCRKIYWRIFAMVIYYVTLSLGIGLAITYIPELNIWFDGFTDENGRPQYTVLTLIFFVCAVFLSLFYFMELRNNRLPKTNYHNILMICVSIHMHLLINFIGLKAVLFMFFTAIILMGLTILIAINIPKDFRHLRSYVLVLLAIGLLVFWIIEWKITSSGSIKYINEAFLAFCGYLFTFIEIQELRFSLPKVQNQTQLENLFYPTIMNLLGNMLLFFLFMGVVKILVKLCACRPLDINFPQKQSSEP